MTNQEKLKNDQFSNKMSEVTKKSIGISKFEKMSLFFFNAFTYFIFASTSAGGVALPEFSKILNASITQLSLGMALQAIFGCIGSLIATYTLDKWNRQLQFSAVVLWLGLSNFLVPFCANLNVYFFILTLSSIVSPIIISVPSVWTVELFKENSSFYLQILHFFFSLGSINSPLIVAPFLSQEVDLKPNLNETFIDSNKNSFEFFKIYENSKLWIPYFIFGGLQTFNAICLIVAYVIKPYEKYDYNYPNKKQINEINKSDDKNINTKKKISKEYKFFFLTSICLLTALQIGSEINSMSFLPSYLIKSSLGLSPKQAAYHTTFLCLCIAIGRLINSFISFKIKTETMLFFNFILMILGNILLYTLGTKILIATCLSLALIGLGYSSTYPLIFSYIEKHITLTNKISTIMSFSTSFYLACSPSLIGYFLESNPSNFIIFNLIVSFIMLLIFLTLNLVDYLKKKN